MKKGVWVGLSILVLLAAVGGGGYWAYTHYFVKPSTVQAQTLRTAVVSRGDIVITADGTGNLMPSAEKTLTFRVSGTVAEVNVKVGDKVKAGDVLAKLEMLDLESAVRDATYSLEQARLSLQKAQRKAESGTELAIAAQNLENARLGIISAQGNYSTTLMKDITAELQKAKFWDDFWQGELQEAYLSLQQNPNSDNRRIRYEDMGARAAEAHANYLRIQQEYDNNLVSAQRSLVSAQQSYLAALENYNNVTFSDPVKEAELAVLQAETKLTQAQANLQNATLIAPISGTITAVTLEAGKSAGSAYITISDLDNPMVRFYVEESSYDKVIVGNAVSVTFESLEGRTFTGKIVSVSPSLVKEGNTMALQADALLDRPARPVTFLSGMSAEVTVIARETHGAALVPLEALRELVAGQYAVFVVKPDGTLELRPVQVGLKNLVNAEILSGVSPGEVVSLGTQTGSTRQATQSTRSTQSRGADAPVIFGPGMPPGGMP